jgi:RNA polymerase sigma-70 factor (ECF subfamily)
MNDIALARRLAAGDESAFDEFFADYFPRLYRFARARLGANDAAEEVVQATMIKAVHRIHTYRGEAALFTWLCAVCRREIATWIERAGQAPLSIIEDHPDVHAALEALAASTGDDPESKLRRKETSRLVQATLDHLPGRYGEVLEWRYIEGASVGEVAERLGLGYKAAESLLTRARQAFRDGFALVAPGSS